jgi:protein TonB
VGFALAATSLLSGCGGDSSADQAAPIPSRQVRAVDTPRPAYPPELACAGVGGTVVLSVTVGTAGSPTEVRLVQGSGQQALDAAAQEGVRSWKFDPATRNGQPVPQTIQVPVNYKPPQVRPSECFALDARG